MSARPGTTFQVPRRSLKTFMEIEKPQRTLCLALPPLLKLPVLEPSGMNLKTNQLTLSNLINVIGFSLCHGWAAVEGQPETGGAGEALVGGGSAPQKQGSQGTWKMQSP